MLLTTATALAYEEPAYELPHRGDDYEVRDYAPHLMAKTTVPGGFDETGNTAFRRLEAMIPLSSCLAIRSQTVVAPFSGHARKGTAPERNQFVEER